MISPGAAFRVRPSRPGSPVLDKDEYLDQRVAQIADGNYEGDWLSFEAAIARDGLTPTDICEVVRLREIFASMIANVSQSVAPPAQDEIDRAVALSAPIARQT